MNGRCEKLNLVVAPYGALLFFFSKNQYSVSCVLWHVPSLVSVLTLSMIFCSITFEITPISLFAGFISLLLIEFGFVTSNSGL